MEIKKAAKKPRINAIEYMRGVSMLGVIGIHVGSQYIMNASANIHLIALFEVFTRFSVPIFFFISAFGLFYNLDMAEKFNYREFMKKRFKTVLVPYLIWSFFYTAVYALQDRAPSMFNPLHLVYVLFFGFACYQLYFLVIMLWFYILMPLWIYMVKRSTSMRLFILFILQIAFNYYSSFVLNAYGIENAVLRNLLVYRLNYWVLHYLFIFILGGYLAIHFTKFKKFMQKWRASIAAFCFLSLTGLLAYYYQCIWYKGYTVLEAINTAHQLCPAGVIYTLGATLFLFSEFWQLKLSSFWQKFFSVLGHHSYFAYLCHPVFIALFAWLLVKMNLVMTAFTSIIFYLAVVSASVAAAALCRTASEKYFPRFNALTIGVYPKRYSRLFYKPEQAINKK